MQPVTLKSALKNGKKDRAQQLHPNSAGVDFLNKQFNLYIFTDGREGFDPRLRASKEIKAIFAAHKARGSICSFRLKIFYFRVPTDKVLANYGDKPSELLNIAPSLKPK